MLSVTPIMTVVCVLALLWMALYVVHVPGRYGQQPFVAELVRDVDGIITKTVLPSQPYQSQFGDNTYYVAQRSRDLIAVKSLEDTSGIEPLIEVTTKPTPGLTGLFAATQLVHTLKATPIWKETTEDHWKRLDRVAAELEKVPQFASVAEALKKGTATESRVLWGGYLFNAAAVAILLFGLRSLIWLWRGVRWPWGNQKAWKGNRRDWRAWFGFMALSPMFTLACVVVLCEMTTIKIPLQLGMHVDRIRYWIDECREGVATEEHWLIAMARRDMHFEAIRINIPNQTASDIELGSYKDGVALIHQTTLGRYGWPAKMQNVCLAEIESVSAATADQAIVLQTANEWLRSTTGGGFQEHKELGTLYKTETRWRGVLYSVVAFLIACVACWSAQWLWRGWRIPTRQHDGKCQSCGYSLAGLRAAKCPECGYELSTSDEQGAAPC